MHPKPNSQARIGWRITWDESPESLIIQISIPERYDMLVIVAIMLFGFWYLFKAFLFVRIELNLIVFLVIFSILPVYALLWSFFGFEIVTITTDEIKIKQSLFGMGMTQIYKLSLIKNLRTSLHDPAPFTLERNMQDWGFAGGNIAFDYYGGRLCRFGIHLPEKDAYELVAKIKQYISVPE